MGASDGLAAFCPSCGSRSVGGLFCAACGTRLPVASAPAAREQDTYLASNARSTGAQLWAVLACGAVIVLGSLLPWATAVTILGPISENGTAGDGGVVTLVCGLVIILVGALTFFGASGWSWLGLAASVLAEFVAGLNLANLPASSDHIRVQSGIGIWFCLIGAFAALLLYGLVLFRTNGTRPTAGQPTFRRSDELFSANIAATASRSRRRGAALSAG